MRRHQRLSRGGRVLIALCIAASVGLAVQSVTPAHASGKYYLVFTGYTGSNCPATYNSHTITACSATIQGGANLASLDGNGDTVYVEAGTYDENVALDVNDVVLGPEDGVPGWCSTAGPALVNSSANGASTLCPAYRERNNSSVEAVVNGGFNSSNGDVIRGFDIEGGLGVTNAPSYSLTAGFLSDIWGAFYGNETVSDNILAGAGESGYLCGNGTPGSSLGPVTLTYNLFEGDYFGLSTVTPNISAQECNGVSSSHDWFHSDTDAGILVPGYDGGTATGAGATYDQFTANNLALCLCGYSGTYTGTFAANYNRYSGNTESILAPVTQSTSGGTLDTTNAWWACNTGPGTTGCQGVSNITPGSISDTPYLKLNVHARSGYLSTIAPSTTTQADADLTMNSTPAASGGYVADGTPVHWTFASRPLDTTFCGTGAAAGGATADSVTVSGHGYIQVCSGVTPGTASVCAAVDNATVCYTVTVSVPSGTPTSSAGGGLPYVAANSLLSDSSHYISFVARYRSYAPVGDRVQVDYRDYPYNLGAGFFINGSGTTGWWAAPGINAVKPTYCTSYSSDPYCSMTVDSIVCPGVGYGAQVYGHYTVHAVTRYWQANVNAGGTGTFQFTAVTYSGTTYTSPTITVNSSIRCTYP